MIATTNRHLEQSVEKKEFRQDLFFRLNVVPVHVPPLREHKEDIPCLAEQFLLRFTRKHGVRVTGISPDCMAALTAHDWPGNVREFQNVIERAVILSSDGQELGREHLGLTGPVVTSGAPAVAAIPALIPSGPVANSGVPLAEIEKQHILASLQQCVGNRTHAARQLGISIRTLRNKLHEYGVAPKVGEGEEE